MTLAEGEDPDVWAERMIARWSPDARSQLIESRARELAGANHVHGAIPARFWREAIKETIAAVTPPRNSADWHDGYATAQKDARAIAAEYARLASSAVETDPWGEHRYHGIASDPDGIIRCQKDGFTIDPNAELSRQVITAVETTATPDLLRAELRKMADTIRYREEEDGSWSVELMELPGHVGAGDTLEEAVVMALDAAAALATIPPTAPSGSPPVGLDAERLRAALRNFVDNDTDHFDWEGVARPGHSDPDIARCPGCRSERQRWYDEARAALDVEAGGEG